MFGGILVEFRAHITDCAKHDIIYLILRKPEGVIAVTFIWTRILFWGQIYDRNDFYILDMRLTITLHRLLKLCKALFMLETVNNSV